jgi:hypothetical protein
MLADALDRSGGRVMFGRPSSRQDRWRSNSAVEEACRRSLGKGQGNQAQTEDSWEFIEAERNEEYLHRLSIRPPESSSVRPRTAVTDAARGCWNAGRSATAQ